ncbi:coil containing protein [Vibrio phage 1.084.O._10N.261.49.F5]|nr:coil containing protein [Vibrio phage 1.084.O._10N.261.49.F5]
MSNGLTPDGAFQIQSLTQNIKDLEKSFQIAYNNPKLTVENSTHFGQVMKVIADRETKAYQAIQQVNSAWTLNGAEGQFLDEVLALQGVFRKGATSGVGDAVVQTDTTAIDTTEISAGTFFSGVNGIKYATASSNIVSNRVTAYRLLGSSIQLDTYSFQVTNNVTNTLFSQDFTLSDPSSASKLDFLKAVETFLKSVNPDEENIYVDETNLVLYYGFNAAYELRGIVQSNTFKMTPSLGNRYTLVEAVATTTGYHPLLIKEITGMSPLPLGYVSVTNVTKFSDGTDVETDAAFIERAEQEADSPRSCTRPAIVAGLLSNVLGIEQVKFTKSFTDGAVVVTPTIIGGETKDVAEELYRTQPINNVYGGNVNYTVNTEDNSTEVIYFNRGESTALSVRVTYSTTQNTALTTEESIATTKALTDLSEGWRLGQKIFNFSLLSAVSGAVDIGRFSSLLVEIKRTSEPDSSYSSSDFIPNASELPSLISSAVSYVRTV